MALSGEAVREAVNDLILPDAKAQWGKLDILRRQVAGDLTKTWAPVGADSEYKDLMRKARTPWLEYAASVYADALIVDGHSSARLWRDAWQASGMDGRQGAISHECASLGYSFLLTFPDEAGGVFMRPLSALKTFGAKADEWDEDFELVLHKVRDGGQSGAKRGKGDLHRLFDDEAMHEIHGPLDRPDKIETTYHGMGVNPVSLIPSRWVPDGLPPSPVSRGLNAYKRIVDASFTLQMVGRYGAFPQKWQTGGVIAEDDDGNALIRPSVDSLIHSTDFESKFGSFATANIADVARAVEENLEDLAAVLKIPPHYLLGKVVNVASDAIAAAETSFDRQLTSFEVAMGEGYEAGFRKAAIILQDVDAAFDTSAEMHWSDHSIRPIGAAVDAAVKLDQMGADKRDTFQLVPGWTKADAERNARGAYAAKAREERAQQTSPRGAGDAVTATAETSPAISTDSRRTDQ